MLLHPTKTVRIKAVSKNAKLPAYTGGEDTSNWVDLYTSEDAELKAGEYKLIPLGVCMHLPAGYEAIVAPRSSTCKNWGILQANSIGIIDESYCGDNDQWYFPAYAIRDTHIPAGTRICQFRILQHQPTLLFEPVGTLGTPDRGGIGSTGTR